MDLEKRLGLRSSFNFVGRDYAVPEQLLKDLNANGFEIGVHGLHHNGLMYASRWIFQRHASGIRACLRAWNAVGFRSPAMHRRLDWLHELGIRYDSSTFDTDPFEPQPQGAGTIFPFWVINRAGTAAYVELPYTLPQDSTLFILLRKNNIDIWKSKLDWIASHGGMALLIVHPDYFGIDNQPTNAEHYPGHFYEDFLEYVRAKYAGQYWNALPREVASYFALIHPIHNQLRQNPSDASRLTLRLCMPDYSLYENDVPVPPYAEALARSADRAKILSPRPPRL